MKILIYGLNFWPEPTGIGKYSGEMAAWLAAQGHEVHAVVAPPYYPAWSVADGYRRPWYRQEAWAGVRVWRAPIWVPRNLSGIARVFHLASFALASVPAVLRQVAWRPNIVFTVAPALTCAPVGWLAARLAGARAWLHIQDFEVDVAFNMELLKARRLRATVLWLERRLLRRFDVVSSISHRMVERLLTKGVEENRICHFPNWVDIEAIRPLASPSPYCEQLGIPPGTTVVLFSGTLGAKQGLLLIPEVARRLRHRSDILFVICGNGPIRPLLEAAAGHLPNLKLLPLQPSDRFGDLLGLAGIHLLPQSAQAEDLVLPSKLSGMLASGRCIVATCRADTEIASIVSQCGEVVAPEDGVACAAAIERLADDPVRRSQLGDRARKIAEQSLDREAVLARVAERMTPLSAVNAQAREPIEIA